MGGASAGGAAAVSAAAAAGIGTSAGGAAPGGVIPLLGLVFATLGILALAWWVSRWVGLHGVPPQQGQGGGQFRERFRVLGQLYLGRNERLALVRFQDRCLLLGVTEHSITLLRELDAEESAAYLADAKEPPGFADILGGVLKNREWGVPWNRERESVLENGERESVPENGERNGEK